MEEPSELARQLLARDKAHGDNPGWDVRSAIFVDLDGGEYWSLNIINNYSAITLSVNTKLKFIIRLECNYCIK